MKRYMPISVVAVLAMLAGCTESSSPTTAPSAGEPQTMPTPAALAMVAEWRLFELNGQPVRVMPGQTPTLMFDAPIHRVSGFAGVNRFSGGYASAGNALTFGPMAGTRMAGPPEAMQLEDAYFTALRRTTGWRITGERLDLLAGGLVVARFEKPMR